MDVSAQHAAHVVSGSDLYRCSRSFELLCVNGLTIDDELHANDPATIRMYMARPQAFEDRPLLQLLKTHSLRGRDPVACSLRRGPEAIVRIVPQLSSDPNGPNFDTYCMQFLALHKPFRLWSDLAQGFASTRLAYEALVQENPLLREFDHAPHLHEAVQQAHDALAEEEPPPEQQPDHDPWMAIVNPDAVP